MSSLQGIHRKIHPRLRRRFTSRLLTWYRRQGRTFPWRDNGNPYHVLISEIMLQQTQVSRVLLKFPEFLSRFPTLRSIARATRRDVVIAWSGMGYNNRAVRLYALAKDLVDNHGGKIPRDSETLLSLPGIGRYTASALLSGVHGKRVPLVDVNVRRFLSRVFWRMDALAGTRTDREIWELAEMLLPVRHAYDWNQALMDMGAAVCTARRPLCTECPVAMMCRSRSRIARVVPRERRRARAIAAIPDRIYRGRIVEELRSSRGISVDVLHKKISREKPGRDVRWLLGLLGGLEKDGLVVLQKKSGRAGRRVSLA